MTASTQSVTVSLPEYGTVEAAGWLLLLAVVVARASVALATAVGTGVVLRAREEFRVALDGFLFLAERFLAEGTLVTVRPVNAALGLGFLVGVGLLARGLDRLLVGGVREALHHRYRL
jgi:hypothetical protein